MLKKFVIAGLLLMGMNGFAGEGWLTDYDAAVTKAKQENKTLLLDFSGSDWCGWCIKLDKEVFSQKAFKDYATEKLVTVLVDFPRGKKQSEAVKKQNDKLAKKYQIRGFPTVILLDADGNLIARTGYQRGGAESYVSHLKKLISAKEKAK